MKRYLAVHGILFICVLFLVVGEMEEPKEEAGRMKFSKEQLVAAMRKKGNIRNLSVVGHMGHGKTTLIDSLVAHAGIISSGAIGETRFTDLLKEEQERYHSIEATPISLYMEIPPKIDKLPDGTPIYHSPAPLPLTHIRARREGLSIECDRHSGTR